ncbi:MAG: T9SS type A sorting domain-containing protein [Phaeodactylibacter xiamenensis]|uniref:P/Homo B domain-containing protein n=1 Tax=Phaeodactylibacter xiamenensis TaxID=1524460 RepID=A0A098S848_9BACT|nr:T9SS type A sorting domain-containing protein [Phaeodactylibacter xiamenensis]KGE88286.1 hypothetical protein IX84_10810 [Phaeodactylibacter xiamenensis]MCR9050998.1 T9SS type A sorting domain-containing protein [bacterium]
MHNRLLILLLLAVSLELFGQKAVPVPGASPLSEVPVIALTALDNEALLQEELDSRGPERPPRFAQRREVDIRPTETGLWEDLPNGDMLWRLRIQSPNAHSINLGFTEYYMPAGGRLLLYDPLQTEILGPFTPSDNEGHQQLWTPVLGGDDLVLEVVIPAHERPNLRLRLTSINHDFLNFFGVTTGACHLDVLCGEANGWGIVDLYRDVIQSVAVYGMGGETFCTGALINNTDNDCRPYFLSAFHCDVTPSNAPSVVVYWNYQNSYCRQPGTVASSNPGNGSLNNFNTGATYRAGYQPSDFVLLELDDPIPSSSQAYFAGWSREATPPQDTVICVHHPDGAEKRISFAFNDTYPGIWGNGNQEVPNGNHLIVPDWSVGSTEVGSSGAPLFNKQGRIVGQLHGGGASCSNDEYDAFGWIRSSWEGGGTSTSRLKDWLAPNGENLFFLEGRLLSSCNASIFIQPSVTAICIPGTADFEIEIAEAFTGTVNLEVNGLPAGVDYSLSPATASGGSTVTLTLNAYGPSLTTGMLSFSVTAADEYSSVTESTSIFLVADAPQAVATSYPEPEAAGVSLAPEFSWLPAANATGYDLQISVDSGFSNLVASLSNLGGTTYQGATLDAYSNYHYRVRARNLCGPGDWSEGVRFSTSAIRCETVKATEIPLTISSSSPNTISSALDLDVEGTIGSVSLRNIEIDHTYVGDLSGMLRSPGGTAVQLFDRPGFPLIPFGCPGDDLFLHFSDDADASPFDLEGTCGNEPAISGEFRPGSPLSSLIGEVAAGEWQLILFDNFSQDGGQLKNWEIEICTTYPPAAEVFLESDILEACTNQIQTFEIFVGTGFIQPVELGIAGLPDGVSATFQPEVALPGTFASLTLDSMYSVSENDILIYGSDGNTIHFCELELQIGARPNPPILFNPDNASPVFQGEQSFSWSPSVGADSFRLEISQDTAFQSLTFSKTVAQSYFSLPSELDAGPYFWRVVALNRCGTRYSPVFSFFKEGAVTATRAENPIRDARIFPNPTTGLLHVWLPAGSNTVRGRLYNVQGQLLQETLLPEKSTLRLQAFPAGVYWLQLQMEDRMEVHKVVLQ